MARHSQEPEPDEVLAEESGDADPLDSEAVSGERSAAADKFWRRVGVQPIEIALPKGVGYTLRAYRMSDALTVDEPEEATDEDEAPAQSDTKPEAKDDDTDDEDIEPDEDAEHDEPSPEDFADEDEDDDTAETDKDDEPAQPEEVPLFLSHGGTLPLFTSAEALVKYVRSEAPTDLAIIDTFDELVDGIKPEYVVADSDDRYELDLVVKNLRGGHDTWDIELLIGAGEVARDLGFALRLNPVIKSLAPGSPLDDLDDALRAIADGGLRAMFAKRRARKIGLQQASTAWRGIIGKIGDAVDWRK